MAKVKRVKVWVEIEGYKVVLYEVPPTLWKQTSRLIDGYECKPKKKKSKKDKE